MYRIAALSALVCVFLTGLVMAADPTAKNLEGKWVREADGITIEFLFKEKKLEIKLEKDGAKLVLDNDFQTGRDSSIFARVVEAKADGIESKSEKGDLFTMGADVDGDKLTIKELKGTRVSDQAKALVEGEYKKK